MREQLEKQVAAYIKSEHKTAEDDIYIFGEYEGWKMGHREGMEEGGRAAWRKLFWLMLGASFCGTLFCITAILLISLIPHI